MHALKINIMTVRSGKELPEFFTNIIVRLVKQGSKISSLNPYKSVVKSFQENEAGVSP